MRESQPYSVELPLTTFQSIIENNQRREQVMKNGRFKEPVLNGIENELDQFDSIETELLIKNIFSNLANGAAWDQEQRAFVIKIFPLVKIEKISTRKLSIHYSNALTELVNDADYEKVDALLQVGKVIAPRMTDNTPSIKKQLDRLVSLFEGEKRKYIYNKKIAILTRIPDISSKQSLLDKCDYDIEIKKLIDQGKTNLQISIELKLPLSNVRSRIFKLLKSGKVQHRKGGKPKKAHL